MSHRARPYIVVLLVSMALIGCTEAAPEATPRVESATAESAAPSQGPPTQEPAPQRGPHLAASATGQLGALKVHGDGFESADPLELVVCDGHVTTADNPLEFCDLGTRVLVDVTGADGQLEAELSVRGHIGVGGRAEVLCDEPGACALAVVDAGRERVHAVGTIPEGAVPKAVPAPVLEVSDLVLHEERYEATVRVSGTGFQPGEEIALSQCPAAGVRAVAGEDCLYDYGLVGSADDLGSFIADMTVYTLFQRSSGEYVDCVEEPELCVIAVPWPKNPATRMAIAPLGAVFAGVT